MVVDQEVLSNCCGASMAGEPSNNFTSTTLEGRCSDCKEMAEFGNQASEDKLEQHLLNDKAFQHILKFAPNSQRELMTFELARYINALIRTEKLKLLAEVRERVVGEGEEQPDFQRLPQVYDTVDLLLERNKLRSKQITELAKLEAEL